MNFPIHIRTIEDDYEEVNTPDKYKVFMNFRMDIYWLLNNLNFILKLKYPRWKKITREAEFNYNPSLANAKDYYDNGAWDLPAIINANMNLSEQWFVDAAIVKRSNVIKFMINKQDTIKLTKHLAEYGYIVSRYSDIDLAFWIIALNNSNEVLWRYFDPTKFPECINISNALGSIITQPALYLSDFVSFRDSSLNNVFRYMEFISHIIKFFQHNRLFYAKGK